MAYYVSATINFKRLFAYISIILIVIGFIIALFATGQGIDKGVYENEYYTVNGLVWGNSTVEKSNSIYYIQREGITVMAIGSLLSLIFGLVLPAKLFKSSLEQSESIMFVGFAIIVILGGIMMFNFEPYIMRSFVAAGFSVSKFDSVSSTGCVISGILFITGGVLQAISCFLKD